MFGHVPTPIVYAPSDIAKVEIDEILDKFSTEEAVNLIAGVER